MNKPHPDVLKKLNDLLNNQAGRSDPAGRSDLTSEQRLMWFDSLSHLCDVPRRGLTKHSRLRTICGAWVTTAKLALVEESEFFDPSCPDCFAKSLSGMFGSESVRSGAGRLSTSLYTLAMLMVGIYFAPSFGGSKAMDMSNPELSSTSSAEPGHGQKAVHIQSARRHPTGLEEFKRRTFRQG